MTFQYLQAKYIIYSKWSLLPPQPKFRKTGHHSWRHKSDVAPCFRPSSWAFPGPEVSSDGQVGQVGLPPWDPETKQWGDRNFNWTYSTPKEMEWEWNEINSPRLRDSRMISLPTEPYRTTMNHSAFWGSLVILRHLFFNNRLTTISSCDVAAQNLESSRIHPLGAVALNAFLHHTFSSLHLLRQRHRLNHCEPKSSGRSFL